jgi:hypothetical protein
MTIGRRRQPVRRGPRCDGVVRRARGGACERRIGGGVDHVDARERTTEVGRGKRGETVNQDARRVSVADVRRLLVGSRGHQPSILIGAETDLPPHQDNTACLVKRPDDSWVVSYFERGNFFDERVFSTEDEACRDFLGMLGVPIEQ